jgi:hypothetical protein
LKELSSIYLGLIWQHTAGITFVTGTSQVPFNALLGHWVQNPAIAKALQTLNVSLNAIQSANEELNEIKKQEYDESQLTGKLEMKAKRFTVYGQLVNKGLGLAEIFIDPSHSSAGDRLKEIRDYWPAFTSGIITMTKDFKEEEYSLGISKLAEILRTVSDYLDEVQRDKTLAGNLSSDLGAALAVRKARLDSAKGLLETRIIALPKPTGAPLLDANIEGERQELLTSLHEIETELKQIKFEDGNRKSVIFRLSRVIEYIDLLAAITKAENSEAVESLLESYALPAGSSRIKKIAAFNIAVNAYVGGFFGRPKNQGEGFTNTYGFTAPIGFSFSTGFRKAGSLSLFANILDIGGAIRYKLDNQGKYQQDISLAGIVSPGVHAVFGFPWFIPVSAGLGCQWVSPVTSNSNKIELKAGFNAFVAVDIPLFNLKVKKGK